MTSPLKAELQSNPLEYNFLAPTFLASRVLLDLIRLPEWGRGDDFCKVDSLTALQVKEWYRHDLLSSGQPCWLTRFDVSRICQRCHSSFGGHRYHWPPPGVSRPATAKRGITIAASKKGTKSFFTVVHGIPTVGSKKWTKTVGFLIISLRQWPPGDIVWPC